MPPARISTVSSEAGAIPRPSPSQPWLPLQPTAQSASPGAAPNRQIARQEATELIELFEAPKDGGDFGGVAKIAMPGV